MQLVAAAQRRILIVDDSEICRETAAFTLRKLGYQVTTMDGPLGLSRVLNALEPDLVLVDVCMPALRGDELIAVVRSHARHVCPLVLYSDRPEPELNALVTSSGAAGYISKSSSSKELARWVQHYLAHDRS